MDAQSGAIAAKTMPNTRSWWDERFTHFILDAIPKDCQQVVEYGCVNANAAHALLPALPAAHYVGIAVKNEILREAERQVMSSSEASRISLRLGDARDLPIPDTTTDVFLSVLALQHCTNVKTLLAGELPRILRPGGHFVAIEPDNLGQRFYYDGVLEEITQTFHAFCLRARVLRQPADIAIGPRLPALLKHAGFANIQFEMHLVGSTRYETAKAFCDRVSRVAEQTAKLAGIYAETEEYRAVVQAIRRFRFSGLPKRLGHSAHLVPAFRVSATLQG
ncbi:MAG: methyltransferase domain-containing protein [Deltaproteobacteria bacterium]|nr:methyltransferase domain-containing protein [Deltaproteobacteria bacterium]